MDLHRLHVRHDSDVDDEENDDAMMFPIEAVLWNPLDDDDEDEEDGGPPVLVNHRQHVADQQEGRRRLRRNNPDEDRAARRMEDERARAVAPAHLLQQERPLEVAQHRLGRRLRMGLPPLRRGQQRRHRQRQQDQPLPVAVPVAVPVVAVAEEVEVDVDIEEGDPGVILGGEMQDLRQLELQLLRAERELVRGREYRRISCSDSNISPYLFDLIHQDLPCSSVMDGSQVRGCQQVVQRCRESPTEILYRCPRTGRTPLHVAALRGSCSHVLQALWDSYPIPRRLFQPDKNGANTPLHLFFMGLSRKRLSETEALQRLELLLGPESYRKTIADASNIDGCRPLHCACEVPSHMIHSRLIRRLVDIHPNIAASTTNLQRCQTPLHVFLQQLYRPPCPTATTIVDDAFDSEMARIATWLADNCPRVTQDSVKGWNVMHYAAKTCRAVLMQQLLQIYDDHVPHVGVLSTRHEKWTPLHILVQQDMTEHAVSALEVLVRAAPGALGMRDTVAKATPINWFLRHNTTKTTSHGMNDQDATMKALQIMIHAMPSCLSIQDMHFCLPLHVACDHGQDCTIIANILEAYPEAAFVRTKSNDTALSLACTTNQSLETIHLLLRANPSALTIPNRYGFVPLHCICRAYQPRLEIVQALVHANPSTLQTCTNNPNERAIHLVSNNASASVCVIQAVTPEARPIDPPSPRRWKSDSGLATGTIENTPLHLACFRGAPLDTIESLAQSHPLWVTTRNNAGYTPLQILCKNGHIDVGSIQLFAKLAGPNVFVDVDSMGNTPLHSALREETDPHALIALLQANPSALHMKTMYDDTPLHIACLRRVHPDVVRQLVLKSTSVSSSNGSRCGMTVLSSPVLVPNTAGQTPIGIAAEGFERQCLRNCSNCIEDSYDYQQQRAFDTLTTLLELLHYSPSSGSKSTSICGTEQYTGSEPPVQPSLLVASLSLHRMGVRLHPAFIRRVLHQCPNEARQMVDEHANYPLHMEASVPVEKMGLLDGTSPSNDCRTCGASCSNRLGLLRTLWELYPDAASHPNAFDCFPLTLMVQSGRPWDDTFALILQSHPPALHSLGYFDPRVFSPILLHRLYQRVGKDAVFNYLRSGAPSWKAELQAASKPVDAALRSGVPPREGELQIARLAAGSTASEASGIVPR